jgi:cytochrome c oxidase cbb3-type subunit I/II
MSNDPNSHWHRRLLEGRSVVFALLTTVCVSIGGLVEIVPMFTVSDGRLAAEDAMAKPYTPLEVAGRDIYVREGCMVCHSQMVRPFRDETLRYGRWSHAEEYRYDRPFLLGSRRIGPDLHRVGGKYPDSWHYEHMRNPRDLAPGSIMPNYAWLLEWEVDPANVQASLSALQTLGTPYSDQDIANAPAQMAEQGGQIVERLATAGIDTTSNKEIVALIAYLQRLGRNTDGPIAQGGAQ